MLHDLFTIEIIGKPQGGLNNFEHNCRFSVVDVPNHAKHVSKTNNLAQVLGGQYRFQIKILKKNMSYCG